MKTSKEQKKLKYKQAIKTIKEEWKKLDNDYKEICIHYSQEDKKRF